MVPGYLKAYIELVHHGYPTKVSNLAGIIEISSNNIVNKGCEVVRLRYTGVNQLHGSRTKRKGIEMMRGMMFIG